jgi:hypothetical protein
MAKSGKKGRAGSHGARQAPKGASTSSHATDNKRQAPSRSPPDSTQAAVALDPIDTLLRQRWHGAVNIRGIRYQVRYAVVRTLEIAGTYRVGAVLAVEDHQFRGIGALPSVVVGESSRAASVPIVQFEGIEDVDVLTPEIEKFRIVEPSDRTPSVHSHAGEEFVQLKTAAQAWSWSDLAAPVAGFLELLRTGASVRTYRLVVNFELKGDLAALARIADLRGSARADVLAKWRKLCSKVGGVVHEADLLIDRFVLESVDEQSLRQRFSRALSNCFGVADKDALEAFELALVGQALHWSAERAAVSAADVFEVGRRLGEGLARQAQFAAVAERLIAQAPYVEDHSPHDFFAGKRARIGHVASGLDVRRADWLKRIEAVLTRVGVCVLRAPSGHGKSTLAFRYAVENWPQAHTFQIRSAATAQEVAALADYLQFRAQVCLPSYILIDGDYRTRLWPEVAQAARAVGAQVLVTVRSEDFTRFDVGALTQREVLEPKFSRIEAEEIFAELRKRHLVHERVPSAAWAYERLRTPALLLEYVYLVTHGEMLQERLRDQVREFDRQGEDPKKREVLRIVSLASALGAPVQTARLLSTMQLRDDPQIVVGTMVGEYLQSEDGLLSGLHWVRSEHLARLLHEGGVPSVTQTALTAAALVPIESLSFFVANAWHWDGIDRPELVSGLARLGTISGAILLSQIADGLFLAGERAFFSTNRHLFDAAFQDFQHSGVSMLSSALAPLLKIDFLGEVIEGLGTGTDGFRQLRDLVQRAEGQRGLDLVRDLLREVGLGGLSGPLRDPRQTTAIGQLLDWCALAGVAPHGGSDAARGLLANFALSDSPPEVTAGLVQAVFRYDRSALHAWFAAHKEDWLALIQRQTAALTLTLTTPSSVKARDLRAPVACEAEAAGGGSEDNGDSVSSRDRSRAEADAHEYGVPEWDVNLVFAFPPADIARAGDETRRRLDFLRCALPQAGRYFLQGDFLLPPGVSLPVDNTRKAVPRWNLHFPSDVAKNGAWGRIALRSYLPDTSFELQRLWYEARKATLCVVRGFELILTQKLRRRGIDLRGAFGEEGAALEAFNRATRVVPWLTERDFDDLRMPLSPALRQALANSGPLNWLRSVRNFVRQAWEYLSSGAEREGRLAVHNIREAADHLDGLSGFFVTWFRESPDYFGAALLDSEERKTFSNLVLLADGAMTNPVPEALEFPVAWLRERASREGAADCRRIADALRSLEARGISIVPPRAIASSHGIRRTLIGVEVRNLAAPIEDLAPVLAALREAADRADWFHFLPIREGARPAEGAYSISARHLISLTNDEGEVDAVWGLMTLTAIPDELLPFVPDLPIVPVAANPDLPSQYEGLRIWADVYAARRRAIESIGAGSRNIELESLQRELREALSDLEAGLRQAADTFRLNMNNEFTAQDVRVGDAVEALGAGTKIAEHVHVLTRAESVRGLAWPEDADERIKRTFTSGLR